MSDKHSEIAEALQEMLALWERVHGAAIIGRPTVNAAKKTLAVYLAAIPNHKQGGENTEAKEDVCEWTGANGVWETDCGRATITNPGKQQAGLCKCGKPINIKEG